MKYLFIVQGEGRGHMTQAIALADMLRRNGHQITEVLLGKSKGREVPSFFREKIGTKVRVFDSPNFTFSKNRKTINLTKTVLDNIRIPRLRKYSKSMEMIHRRIEKNRPDAVVNFYEILAGLTNLRFSEDVPFINIGHQFLIRHPDFGHGRGDGQGLMFLRLHALICGVGATKTLVLSLYPLRDVYRERMAVVPPLLRREVLDLDSQDQGFILGYMLNHGYADEVIRWHKNNPQTKLHIFWDKKDAPKELKLTPNLTFHAIDDVLFLRFMANCSGYITTAGFESVCEARYLGKPIMMIPAHIEQQINALDAAAYGCGIVGHDFDVSALAEYIAADKEPDTTCQGFRIWVDSAEEQFIRHLTTLV